MKRIFLFSLLFSLNATAAIYGPDNRQLLSPSHSHYALSRSVAVLVPNNFIEDSKTVTGTKDLATFPLTETQYLCPSERFASQPSFHVSCTGFLIAPDLLMTAGHCAVTFGETHDEANPYCTDFSWYFDFEADSRGRVKTTGISAENIYQCEKIIQAAHTSIPVSETVIDFKDDFAIIKLKKAVKNRTPLKLTTARPLPGDNVTILGHPLGAPKTISTGQILSNEATYDRSNVHSFQGNSGSPMLNSKGEVFGILVRGYPPSLIEKPGQQCNVVNHCNVAGTSCTQPDPDGQRIGEHSMPISLINKLKELGLVN